MRDTIKNLNKATLSEATGISYGRLRKYSTGAIKKLSDEENDKIYLYLIEIAKKFKN